jgi:dTDP-4-amino-4,6-dideoxygalactose transaminase
VAPSSLAPPTPATFAVDGPVRFQQPELPSLQDIAPYYALSEEAAWYSNGGPCATLLAERLADYLGGDVEAIPVGNCTVGLMVALRAHCGEPTARRPYVVVPSFTFTATACAVVWAGFEPLFVDVLPDSWQMDPEALERALSRHRRRIAGVLACSTFGTAPPQRVRDGWRLACAAAGIPLLLDSAAGFGAVDEHGRAIGALGETEVFSFHATKPMAVGEGGAVVTGDPEIADRVRRLINFGMEAGGRSSAVAGVNGKCSELHAATGLAALDRLDDALGRRRATARAMRDAIEAGGAEVGFQVGWEGATHQTCQLTVPTAADRERALRAAGALDVQARAYFDPPVHRQPAFRAWPSEDELTVTDALAARSLSLPMANDLAPAHVERVAAVVGSLGAAGARRAA